MDKSGIERTINLFSTGNSAVMAGTITVGGKILASHSNSDGKLSINNDVVFPAGHIIQVITNETSTKIETTGTVKSVGLEQGITPKLSGSKLIFNYSLEGVGQNTNQKRLYFYWYKDGTLLYQTDGIDHYADGTTEQYSRSTWQLINNSTTAGVLETYDLRFSTDGGTASVTRGSGKSTLVIYEVVQ